MVHELGTVGMVCPFPLIEAQKKMNTLDNGEESVSYTHLTLPTNREV